MTDGTEELGIIEHTNSQFVACLERVLEAHLMMLLAAIEGVPVKFPFERFQATREAYRSIIQDS